jgi:hypothetical protein
LWLRLEGQGVLLLVKGVARVATFEEVPRLEASPQGSGFVPPGVRVREIDSSNVTGRCLDLRF